MDFDSGLIKYLSVDHQSLEASVLDVAYLQVFHEKIA